MCLVKNVFEIEVIKYFLKKYIDIDGFKFKYCKINYSYYIMKKIILYIKYFLLFH
jgi:hypothetical protein